MSFDQLSMAPLHGRPHLVITGAGASLQALPNGDKTGKCLPLMSNLVEVLGLQDILDECELDWSRNNFENIYADLASDPRRDAARAAIEERVAQYFAALELPASPTIYDYLVLSLRSKDLIATFNWDPFLLQAAKRNGVCGNGPGILFLHGCAAVGICTQHGREGPLGEACPVCQRPLEPTRLLYPVREKNYNSEPYIASRWRVLRAALSEAYVVTVFGYGAPQSDAAAIDLMSAAWGRPAGRNYEQTEIIDVLPEDDLRTRWSQFIHSHHYQVTADYFTSLIGLYPRRSCEAIWQQTMEIQFLEQRPIPRFTSLIELQGWFAELRKLEEDLPFLGDPG